MERQCLPSGRWFSCSSQGEADDASASPVDVGGTQDLILPAAQGWTNYSHCWADTTRKLMKDLNVSAGCPSDEQSGLDESSVSQNGNNCFQFGSLQIEGRRTRGQFVGWETIPCEFGGGRAF